MGQPSVRSNASRPSSASNNAPRFPALPGLPGRDCNIIRPSSVSRASPRFASSSSASRPSRPSNASRGGPRFPALPTLSTLPGHPACPEGVRAYQLFQRMYTCRSCCTARRSRAKPAHACATLFDRADARGPFQGQEAPGSHMHPQPALVSHDTCTRRDFDSC
jgi:hypothetical protein